jgi:hypothetical protein
MTATNTHNDGPDAYERWKQRVKGTATDNTRTSAVDLICSLAARNGIIVR